MKATSCKRCGRRDRALVAGLVCEPCAEIMTDPALDGFLGSAEAEADRYLDCQAAALRAEVYA